MGKLYSKEELTFSRWSPDNIPQSVALIITCFTAWVPLKICFDKNLFCVNRRLKDQIFSNICQKGSLLYSVVFAYIFYQELMFFLNRDHDSSAGAYKVLSISSIVFTVFYYQKNATFNPKKFAFDFETKKLTFSHSLNVIIASFFT